jgi:pyruvate dehydrogenase E2 component (dihydrolipoamide acetyltransferase)
MAVAVTIPRLGWNMDEGIFVAWLKQDGDRVRPGDALFSLEGEKATEDIEALDGGILRIGPDGPKEGQTLPVGAVVAYLVETGERAPFEDSPPASAPAAKVNLERPAPAAVVRQTSASAPGRRPASSPRARRVAAELGIDWAQLRGSGRAGRIRERDVREAATSRTPAAMSGRELPVSAVRKTIAERMLASARSTAAVTLTTTVDATNLVNLRNQFKAASGEPVPSYTDFLVKLTAFALREHPLLNASWAGEHVVVPAELHIGLAVDTEAGLLVPVLRDVPGLGLRAVAARSRELIERARQGKLRAEEMHGGTFTVTSLGAFGVDAFTPIINYPQCAILGVGRIQRRPAAEGERVVVRDQLTLSLTFDHRVVDGAPAARFLQSLSRLVENPGPALVA